MPFDTRPVDLAAPAEPLLPTRWAVVWWTDGVRHEFYSSDRAFAQAYAASHRGRVVPLTNLEPWPVG